MSSRLFRLERRGNALLALSINGVLLVVACGSDNSTVPDTGGASGVGGGSAVGGASSDLTGGGHGGLAGAAQSGSAGKVGGAAGTVGGDSAATAGAPSTSGANGGVGTAGPGGSAGQSSGGSAGGIVTGGSGGGAGESGAGNDGGAAGATDCGGVHGCPEPTVLASVPNPFGIALDGTYVYWTTLDASGSVQRVPIVGGPPEPIATGEVKPFDLAVAGGNAFWCLNDSATGHLGEAPVGGGGRLQLATGIKTFFPGPLSDVSSDGAFAYYVTNFNEIAEVPVGAANGTQVFISIGPFNSNIIDMVRYGDHLYYTNNGIWLSDYSAKMPSTAAIKSVNISGTATGSVSLVTQLNFPLYRIAVDGTRIFWNNDQKIYSTGLIGGLATPVTSVSSLSGLGTSVDKPLAGVSPVDDMVSDGTNLYYADSHNVFKVPVAGGSPERVSWGWQAIERMAIDENHVYFTDNGGAVVEMAK